MATKKPDFSKGDPDGQGLSRVWVNWAQTTPTDKLVEAGNTMQRGTKFRPGRHKGSIEDTTLYIHTLATTRKGSAAQLFEIAKRAGKIGDMAPDTFRGHVSRARNKK